MHIFGPGRLCLLRLISRHYLNQLFQPGKELVGNFSNFNFSKILRICKKKERKSALAKVSLRNQTGRKSIRLSCSNLGIAFNSTWKTALWVGFHSLFPSCFNMMIIEAVVESWNGASEIGNEIDREREREMMTTFVESWNRGLNSAIRDDDRRSICRITRLKWAMRDDNPLEAFVESCD